MREVMMKAHELAEAILDSEIYRKMKEQENAAASREMEEAEERMNANGMIGTLKEYRKDFQTMMDNVNRILRLVITGETEDENGGSGCSGNCSGCSGCR